MAKKVAIVLKKGLTGEEATNFNTKTLTKLFNNAANYGQEYTFFVQEPEKSLDLIGVGNYTVQSKGTPPPPVDNAPVVDAGEDAIVKEGDSVTLDGSAHDDGQIVKATWVGPDGLELTPDPADNTKATFTAPTIPGYMNALGLICFFEAKDNKSNISRDSCIITVTKDGIIIPPPPPPEPTDPLVIYDSMIHSKLHDGKVRTITQEGDISPGGMGVECRASGNPRIVVNADGTFSLVCDAGHGRFYLYVINYDSEFEITAAWMNSVAGQDMSLKGRSFHNECGANHVDAQSMSDVSGNCFGGYGYAVDRKGWNAKREPEHNFHDESESGSLPVTLETGKFFTTKFTIKDEGDTVKQLVTTDGKQTMDKTDKSPLPFMVDKVKIGKQSYLWVRQNIDQGTGELRIKRMIVRKLQ